MAKPKPTETPKRYTFWFAPSLMDSVKLKSGKYKTTRSMIEAIKLWLEHKEQLAQTINPNRNGK